MSGGHGPSIEGGNKYVALLIAVLAQFAPHLLPFH